MQAYKLTALAASGLLLGACATTTQPARSASGVSLEVLDACNRVTADYLYKKASDERDAPDGDTPTQSAPTPNAEDPLITTDEETTDPVIERCLDIIDREMQAQAYILANSGYSGGYTSYSYWQPAYSGFGYGHSRFYRPYYNRHGYPYHSGNIRQNRGFSETVGTAANIARRNSGGTSTTTPSQSAPQPTFSPPPPPPPARVAPAPRPQPARSYSPPRSRTNPSVPKQRD